MQKYYSDKLVEWLMNRDGIKLSDTTVNELNNFVKCLGQQTPQQKDCFQTHVKRYKYMSFWEYCPFCNSRLSS